MTGRLSSLNNGRTQRRAADSSAAGELAIGSFQQEVGLEWAGRADFCNSTEKCRRALQRTHLPLSLARASISSKKTMEGATARAFRNTCRPATIEKREADRTLDGDTYDSSWAQTRTGNTAAINAAGYVTVHPFVTSTTKNTNKGAGKRRSGLYDNHSKHSLLE